MIPEDRVRVLKPPTQRSAFVQLPFIFIDDDHCGYWREDTDVRGSDFADLFTAPQSIIVVESSARWADSTSELRERDGAFDFRIARGDPISVTLTDDVGMSVIEMETEWCVQWGLSRKRLRNMERATRDGIGGHQVIDPLNFFENSLNALAEEDEVVRWAYEYREYCRKRNIRISASKGGTGSKILRTLVHDPQCKVPAMSNKKARRHLCSSHIRTFTQPQEIVESAMEYDQKSAYHNCALTVPLPDRNEFLTRGDFHKLRQVWYSPDDEEFHKLTHREHGLLLCTVKQWTEDAYRHRFPFSPFMPWTDEPIALFTNELSLAARSGIEITGIIAAWTSPNRSDELAEHALISRSELAATDDKFTLAWLKPLNLAVYGMTASVPRARRGRSLDGPHQDGRVFENNTNHVVWLGMLQAEVRKRSIMLAMDLNEVGVRVVAIYADAVFAEPFNIDTEQLVPPYFTETHHSQLRAQNNILMSDSTIKAPGIALSEPEREKLVRERLTHATEGQA